jgi:predicted nucleotidyltransferase
MANIRKDADRMKRHSRKEFVDAVEELVNIIVSVYGSVIKAIYVGGSFARGDFVPGRSDVDLYVVGKERNKEELQKRLTKEARKVEQKYFVDLKRIHDEVLSIEVTTLEEMKNGRSFLGAGFEYHNFIARDKLLWGEDVKDIIPKPTREGERKSAWNFLKKIYELIPKWEEQIKSFTEENKERMIRQAFSLVFRGSAIALCGNGIYVSGKKEVADAFKQTYLNEKELCEVPTWALRLWEKWKTKPLSNKEARQLLERSLEFVKQLSTLFQPIKN